MTQQVRDTARGYVMSPEEMKAVHDAHVEAENRKDLQAALATYHDECFYQNVPLGFRVQGKEQMELYYTAVMQAFPDSELVIRGEAYGENSMVAWGNFRATASGSFLGVEGSGARVDVPVVAVLTFKDGLMLGEHLLMDLASIAEQAEVPLDALRQATTIFPQHEAWT